jgi:hypothetical protein
MRPPPRYPLRIRGWHRHCQFSVATTGSKCLTRISLYHHGWDAFEDCGQAGAGRAQAWDSGVIE